MPARTPVTHYFDHAATTPMRACARQALIDNLDAFNPGGQYASGRRARAVLTQARETIARLVGVDPIEVVFTSGGTESDNIAVRGLYALRSGAGRRGILTGPTEHPGVKETVADLARTSGAHPVVLGVDRLGRAVVSADGLVDRDGDRVDPASLAVASLMWANNETGVMQPVGQLADTLAECDVPLHVDATQVMGKIPIDLSTSAITTLAGSAHKFGGPRGIGILIARRSPTPVPTITGGGQERGLRSGTENVAGAAAAAAALEEAVCEMDVTAHRLNRFADEITQFVRAHVPDVVIHTPTEHEQRVAGIVSMSFPGAEGDSLIMLADRAGIEASTGSACHSGVNRASHVLLAMGVDEKTARGTMRISMGHTTTQADVDALVGSIADIVATARLAGMA